MAQSVVSRQYLFVLECEFNGGLTAIAHTSPILFRGTVMPDTLNQPVICTSPVLFYILLRFSPCSRFIFKIFPENTDARSTTIPFLFWNAVQCLQ